VKHLNQLEKKLKNRAQVGIVRYVRKFWLKFVKNNMLNYLQIDQQYQQYRANSILEAYNARIKMKMPFKPNWPRFLTFLQAEEEYFNREFFRKVIHGEQTITSKTFGKVFAPPEDKKLSKKLDFISATVTGNNLVKKSEGSAKNTSLPFKKRNYLEFKDSSINAFEEIEIRDKRFLPDPSSSTSYRPKVLKWALKNQYNSCRYDSFVTLFALKLIHSHPQLSEKGNSLWLNYLQRVANQLPQGGSASIIKFWEYSCRMHYGPDKPGRFGAVSSLFSVFANLSSCTLLVKEAKICTACDYTELNLPPRRLDVLVSINSQENSEFNMQKELDARFSLFFAFCPSCSKQQTEINTLTLSISTEILEFPALLFVVLDYSFDKLTDFRDHRIKLTLGNHAYNLIGAIAKPKSTHFSLLVKNPVTPEDADKIAEGWYYYDDLEAEGDLVRKREAIMDLLATYHAYVLVYEKSR